MIAHVLLICNLSQMCVVTQQVLLGVWGLRSPQKFSLVMYVNFVANYYLKIKFQALSHKFQDEAL